MNLSEEVELYCSQMTDKDGKPVKVPAAVVDSFKVLCERTGLSPLARQVYLINRGGKWVPQTSIDGFRSIASRQEAYKGQDGPYWAVNTASGWTDIPPDGKPYAARVGVYVAGAPGPTFGVAKFQDYSAGGGLWAKFPSTMIAKCAEALALRKAFPVAMQGLYTDEEMAQADGPKEPKEKAPRAQKAVEVKEPTKVANSANMDVALAFIQQAPSIADLDAWVMHNRKYYSGNALKELGVAYKARKSELSALVPSE